uniref:Uncharacterized protein n=1 Tax=Anguilla anguilla TaxID=7936 RepID=A0A0E9TTW1_ANGAN
MPWNPKLVESDLHCVLQRSIPNALIENFFSTWPKACWLTNTTLSSYLYFHRSPIQALKK